MRLSPEPSMRVSSAPRENRPDHYAAKFQIEQAGAHRKGNFD
jgi:hypothetical protein